MENKGIAVKCSTVEQRQIVSNFGRDSIKQSRFTANNDWGQYIVLSGGDAGCHASSNERYTTISYEEFEQKYLKKPKVNSNTDFEFTPGEVYVGSWSSNRNVIFKPHTPLLHNRCQFITGGHDGYRDDVYGCCTGDDISFRKANTDEKIWLEACIKADKFIPLDQLKPAMKKKVENLKYPDVIHITNEMDWSRIDRHINAPEFLGGWQRSGYYVVRGGFSDDKKVYEKKAICTDNHYNIIEFSDIIFPEESSYICKAVTTGNGASLAVGQEYTYGNKNGYRNTVWVVDSITKTTVTFRQKDKPNVKAPYSLTKFPEIINKDQFWLVEDDNFAYFAKIINSGSGMSPDDKGKTVKVLKKRPEGAIANDYSCYDTYFEAIDGVHYQTLKIYNDKDFKYGRCAANMLQREGIEYAEGYQMTVSDKSLVKKITIDEPNLNDLLEKAKKMYPIGTKFFCANGNRGDGFKGGGNENYIGSGIWEVTKYGICDPGQGYITMGIHSGNGWLWYNGNWAMIVDMGQNSNPIPKIDNVLIWRNGEVSNHINPDQIKLSDSSVQIKVPTSASVTLKNTENEVKIIVKQSQSIKIN